jgi:hypothetical protein
MGSRYLVNIRFFVLEDKNDLEMCGGDGCKTMSDLKPLKLIYLKWL